MMNVKSKTFKPLTDYPRVAKETKEEQIIKPSSKYMTVAEKIRALDLGPKPYFFPVLDASTPRWNHNAMLIAYTYFPRVGVVKEIEGIDYNKTLLMAESGGYLNEGVRPESQEECMRTQMRFLPDICLTLDYPVKRKRSTDEEIRDKWWKTISDGTAEKRIEETVKNCELALKLREVFVSKYEKEFEIMPVLQGWSWDQHIYCAVEMYSLGFDFFSIGSVGTFVGDRGAKGQIVERAASLRDIVGKKSWIHLLGVTDVDIIIPIIDLIDSFDSATITITSVYGGLRHSDGTTTKIGKKKGFGGAKYKEHDPTDTESYRHLQEINFEAYMDFIKKKLWKVPEEKKVESDSTKQE